jgi:hypothetical protein
MCDLLKSFQKLIFKGSFKFSPTRTFIILVYTGALLFYMLPFLPYTLLCLWGRRTFTVSCCTGWIVFWLCIFVSAVAIMLSRTYFFVDVLSVFSPFIVGRVVCCPLDVRCVMDLGEVGWGDVDWIGLAKDRNRWRAVVNSVLNLRGSMKCRETIEWPNIEWPLE